MEENADLIKECELKVNHPNLLTKMKDEMPLADPSMIIKLGNPMIKAKFSDFVVEKKEKKPKAKAGNSGENKEDEIDTTSVPKFQPVDVNKLKARDIPGMKNDERLQKEYEEATGGKIQTRFPPEPNGILHIGHARAIRFNFSAAGLNEGNCYLRFDDTNPEKESIEFINEIKANVAWMGYEPYKVTHSSDYFQRIFDLTIKLIKMDKCFVCKLPKAKAKELREAKQPSPYRT